MCVLKYEFECIKNMKWVPYYTNSIQWKQTTSLTSLFPATVFWIDGTTNVSDVLLMWLHQKYEVNQIIPKLYLAETNNCSYLAVTDYDKLNKQNYEKSTRNEQKVNEDDNNNNKQNYKSYVKTSFIIQNRYIRKHGTTSHTFLTTTIVSAM